MSLCHAGEDRRGEPETAFGNLARCRPTLSTLGVADRGELLDAGELRGRVDGANVGVLVEWIAQTQGCHPALEAFEHVVINTLLDEQPRTRTAHVTLVEEDAVDDALDGLIQGCVVEHDVGGLATEFEGDFLVRAGNRTRDGLAYRGRTGESDLVDVGVVDDGLTRRTRTRHDVHDARREFGLLAYLGKQQSRQGSGLGGLEDDSVSGSEGGSYLPGQHHQREVPRNDLAGDAERLRAATTLHISGQRVLQLVGPAGVIEKPLRNEGNVDIAGFADRLAVVERLKDSKFAAAFGDDASDPIEILGAFAAGHLRPGLRVGGARCGDGLVDIGRRGFGDFGEDFLGRGRDRLERFALPIVGTRVDEFAVDEQSIGGLDVDDGARLGGWRVFELFSHERSVQGHVVGAGIVAGEHLLALLQQVVEQAGCAEAKPVR